ncbi:MAG: hypothetical protein IJ383_00185 [Bacteroidales bacterium]|nr:hypothetical protein [Bacteroidales bacterium]
MKKILFILMVAVVTCGYAQRVNEPQFIGEVHLVRTQTESVPLEKKVAVLKTKAGAAMYITGIGSIKSRIDVEGLSSTVRCSISDGPIVLIVRAADNENDPSSFIRVFRFKPKGKNRVAEISKLNTFGGHSDNNFDLVEYVGEKYGEKSYKLTLENVSQPCEIGVLITNPEKVDEKQMVVRCLGLD